MKWPDPTDYNDAIQLPQLNLGDAELKEAEVETDMLGLPKVAAGNFASVYRLSRGDESWAVKCFFRNIPERRGRYQNICTTIEDASIPYLIPCEYQEQGIRVGADWFPILKMPWVDGVHLNQFVGQWLSHPKALTVLAEEWLKMLRGLRQAGIAHGDLQHGNVLIVNKRLRLVDYDGMYVPALEGEKSIEGGHPEYQHPNRGDAFGPDLDRFSALGIYTAIQALRYEPGLWETTNVGENMVFRRTDYEKPSGSETFQSLLSHPEEDVRIPAKALMAGCEGGVEAVPDVLDLTVGQGQQQPATTEPPRTSPLPSWVTSMFPDEAAAASPQAGAETEERGERDAAAGEEREQKANAPILFVETSQLRIWDVATGSRQEAHLWFANSGGGALQGNLRIEADGDWLTFDNGSRTHAFEGNDQGCAVVAQGPRMEPGKTHSAKVVIESNGGTATVDVSAKCQGTVEPTVTPEPREEQPLPTAPPVVPKPKDARIKPARWRPSAKQVALSIAVPAFIVLAIVVASRMVRGLKLARERTAIKETLRTAESLLHDGKDEEAAKTYRNALDLIEAFDDAHGTSEFDESAAQARKSITVVGTRQRVSDEIAAVSDFLSKGRNKEAIDTCRKALKRMQAVGASNFPRRRQRIEELLELASLLNCIPDEIRLADDLRGWQEYAKAKAAYEKTLASARKAYGQDKNETLKKAMDRIEKALSAEEIVFGSKGYKYWEGEWITPEEKAEREAAKKEKELLARGYRHYEGKLRSPEEIKQMADKKGAAREGEAKSLLLAAKSLFGASKLDKAKEMLDKLKGAYGSTAFHADHKTEAEDFLSATQLLSEAAEQHKKRKYDEAMATLDRCSDQFTAPEILAAADRARKAVRSDLVQTEGADVLLQITPEDATVCFDGKQMALRKGPRGSFVRVPPGPHTLEVKGDGHRSLKKEVTVPSGGASATVQLAPIVTFVTVYLKSGSRRDGELIEQTESTVKIKPIGLTAMVLKQSEYDRIVKREQARGKPLFDWLPFSAEGQAVPTTPAYDGLPARFMLPNPREDQHGNPVVTRRARRGRGAKEWPTEIWLNLPAAPTAAQAGNPRMEFVFVPAGVFVMGSKKGRSSARPTATVVVSALYMSKYEVTNAQWQTYMNTRPKLPKTASRPSRGSAPSRNPVVNVTWHAAREYASWIGGRLPTEAEWEYACRAGAKTSYCFGDDEDQLDEYAWYRRKRDLGACHPVGAKKPNAWGLYDMHGNVWEWCQSLYKGYPYRADDGREDLAASGHRVRRGGSYRDSGDRCSSAYRYGTRPERSYGNRGFRCVLPLVMAKDAAPARDVLSRDATTETETEQKGDGLSGRTWTGYVWRVDTRYTFEFKTGGRLRYVNASGRAYENGTWQRNGNALYVEMNDRYAEFRGTISGNIIQGQCWNKKGVRGVWRMERR